MASSPSASTSARPSGAYPAVMPFISFACSADAVPGVGGACGFGPFLTPARHVGSPEDLDIKLWLNGELRQDSNTRNHLYTVAEQIAYLSRRVDLLPGDVILTGTPAGVGMESGTFLKRGDVVRVWIAGLGELQSAIQ